MIQPNKIWINKDYSDFLILVDWLIDFNCMSTRLGLFYTLRLGNHIHI